MNDLISFFEPIFTERALTAAPIDGVYRQDSHRFREKIEELKERLDRKDLSLFFEIEESFDALSANEQVAAYMQGLRDGAELLKMLLF